MKRKIVIDTGVNKQLGTGHFQRMANLLNFIVKNTKYTVSLCVEGDRNNIGDLESYIVDEVPYGADLIIRDRRDSTKEEIRSLRKLGQVLVVDDCGEGRDYADFSIDLLPNRDERNRVNRHAFIYGYNFSVFLQQNQHAIYDKNNDVVIYTGIAPTSSHIDYLFSLIPVKYTVHILTGETAIKRYKGSIDTINNFNYVYLLLSSKLLLCHYGISLYEGHLAQCALMTINPTIYHHILCQLDEKYLSLENCGVWGNLDIEMIRSKVSNRIDLYNTGNVSVANMYAEVENKLQNFHTALENIM